MIVLYIPLILGIIFLAVGTIIKLSQNKISKNAILVNGRVVDNVKRRSTSSHSYSFSYYPVYEFTYCEKMHTVESNLGTSRPRFKIDQIVQLKFNPEYPNRVSLANDKLTEYFYLIFILVGILLCIIGIIVLLFI